MFSILRDFMDRAISSFMAAMITSVSPLSPVIIRGKAINITPIARSIIIRRRIWVFNFK
jgi:hypothetical protein